MTCYWESHVFQVLRLPPSVFSITYCFRCTLVRNSYSWFSTIQCFLTNDQEGKQLIYMGRFIFAEMPQGNLSKRPERNSAKRKQQEDPVFLCNSAVLVANTNIITFQSSIFHILKLHLEIPSSKSICYQTRLCSLLNLLLHGLWTKLQKFYSLRISQRRWGLVLTRWSSDFGLLQNCLERQRKGKLLTQWVGERAWDLHFWQDFGDAAAVILGLLTLWKPRY